MGVGGTSKHQEKPFPDGTLHIDKCANNLETRPRDACKVETLMLFLETLVPDIKYQGHSATIKLEAESQRAQQKEP